MSSIRIPASAAQKVTNVAEICNVGKEDAFRVLQQVNMDEEVAVERFLSGKVDTWHEVGDKKRRPGGQQKNRTPASAPSNSHSKKLQQGKKSSNADGTHGRAQGSRPTGTDADPDSKTKQRRPFQQKPKSGVKPRESANERKPAGGVKTQDRTKEQATGERAETPQTSTRPRDAAPPKPSGPTWADRLKPKKVAEDKGAPTKGMQHPGVLNQNSAGSRSMASGVSVDSRVSNGNVSNASIAASAEQSAEKTSQGRTANIDNRTTAPPVSNASTAETPFKKEEQHLSVGFGNLAVSGQTLANKAHDVPESAVQTGRPLEPSRPISYDGPERTTAGLQPATNPAASQTKTLPTDQSAKLSSTEAWTMMPPAAMIRGQPRESMRHDSQQSNSESAVNTASEFTNPPAYATTPEHVQPPQQMPTQVNGMPPNYYGYYPYGMPGHVPNYGYQGYPYYQPYGGYAETSYPQKATPNITNQPLSYASNPAEPKVTSMPLTQHASMNAAGTTPGPTTNYNQSEMYYGGTGYPQQYATAYGVSSAPAGANASGEQARNIRRNRNADFYPPGGSVSLGGGYGSGFGSYYGASHQSTASQPYGGVMYNAQGYGNQAFGGSGFAGQPYAAQPYAAQPYGNQQYPMWQGQRGAGGPAQSPFNGSNAGNAQGVLPGQQSNTYPSY
ncbi:hypothetical protein CCYA_CCYA11G3102 [Cyanidiococcus yangmingshanensis]|nr:hypothetical protein CCYA_CCYA11G3102 [Cyanidiococcus yangmingshanensis]